MSEKYSYDKICKVYDSKIARSTFNSFIDKKIFPDPKVDQESKIKTRYWEIDQLPDLGKIVGFLKNSKGESFLKNKKSATIITSYTRKGGVLKSTLAYNLARIAALNGYNTLIIGLDSQCDITNMMGYYNDLDRATSTKEAEGILENKKGLYNLIDEKKRCKLSELIQKTDLPTLYFIPETDEIEELIEKIEHASYREEWLKRNVIDKIKDKFDLIVLDSSPTSGRLVSNAMIVSDMILSPLECSTNNFKNYARTRLKITKKLEELGAKDILIKHIPTKLTNTSISQDIYKVYQQIPACSIKAIKVSAQMEASTFRGISIIEHEPTGDAANTMREIVKEVFQDLENSQLRKASIPQIHKAPEVNLNQAQL
jgi:chromosome partitioning protein